jgi:hypothetical protein
MADHPCNQAATDRMPPTVWRNGQRTQQR